MKELDDMQYSVLMSVYAKENADFLTQSMMSIYNQTCKTDDFVLICDGPLSESLDSVITDMHKLFGSVLRVIRFEVNKGLGIALKVGIDECRHEIIARMDSDDVSYLDRCEKELKILEDPSIDIVSGTISEFNENPGDMQSRRVLPETNEDILKFCRLRNPFNHPCVMYRKSAVLAVGGYEDFYLLEDYYLWIRMLMSGCRGYNIQEPILYMRIGNDMYRRRSGFKYVKSQKTLLDYMKHNGFIDGKSYIKSLFIRTCSSLAPNFLRELLYKRKLRK